MAKPVTRPRGRAGGSNRFRCRVSRCSDRLSQWAPGDRIIAFEPVDGIVQTMGSPFPARGQSAVLLNVCDLMAAPTPDLQTGFVLNDPRQLLDLRRKTDLAEIVVDTAAFKFRRLLPLALRYALWATAPGGRIVIRDKGGVNPHAPPFEAPFNLVRRWIFKAVGRDTKIAAYDSSGVVELIRVAPILAPTWSAGVVFSGREADHADLERCLTGLVQQPELSHERGGEVVVAGPPGARPGLLDRFPTVKYLDYVEPDDPRFLIGRKKNALIRHLSGPRIAILHARVVLEAGALAALPREFDILSPNTLVLEREERRPYLSLASAPGSVLGQIPRDLVLNFRNVPRRDPLALHRRGGVYVDGGCFFTTKAVHEACPLDDHLGWEEGEDLEWCSRAFANGYISDIALDSLAISTTSRYRPRPRLGPLEAPAEWVVRRARVIKAGVGAGLRGLIGRP